MYLMGMDIEKFLIIGTHYIDVEDFMGSKPTKWIMFFDDYIDKNKNRIPKNIKHRIKSSDSKYFYVNKCKVDKLIDASLYEIGEINSE